MGECLKVDIKTNIVLGV